MSWIKTIRPEAAQGDLADAYAHAAASRGRVANIFVAHGARPRVLLAHLRLYSEAMFGESELSREEREIVALGVSSANGCVY